MKISLAHEFGQHTTEILSFLALHFSPKDLGDLTKVRSPTLAEIARVCHHLQWLLLLQLCHQHRLQLQGLVNLLHDFVNRQQKNLG